MHKLLTRQLKRLQLNASGDIEIDAATWQELLNMISESYLQADESRQRVEHSLKITSNELHERNIELKSHLEKLQRNQEVIQFQAHYDILTKLPNRSLLTKRLKNSVESAHHNKRLTAVVFIDLDHFKKVNDTCGHAKGDDFICKMGERMQSCLRSHDTLARFGGDEFVILLEGIADRAGATTAVSRISKEISKPIDINHYKFDVTASIGISIFPQDDKCPEELIRKADIAMYHAKAKGRNNFQFFSDHLEQATVHHINVENDLRMAIKNRELSLVFQPKVVASNARVVGFEALVRWFPPGKKQIMPGEFIPIAEKTGLIKAIGDCVLEKACEQIKDWRKKGHQDFSISVNISTQELLETQLKDRLEKLLKTYEVPPEYLEIEITENVLIEDLSTAQDNLKYIKELGLKVSLDDFGTGYSSLSYLQNLPIDYLKIDKSFVQKICNDTQSLSIARSIILLGHSLGLKIVAEGAEDKQTVDYLIQHKCDLIQGYYFYKPLPPEEAEETLLARLNASKCLERTPAANHSDPASPS